MFPVSLDITPEILQLIAALDEFKGTWRALNVLSPERLASLKKIATIESIASSTRIEGATLSDREVELLLSRLDQHSFASRDEEEVAGYAETMDLIFAEWNHIPLTENYIKQLHKLLLKYCVRDESHRGHYKAVPNNVEAFDEKGNSLGIIIATASPFEAPHLMQELVNWTQEAIETRSQHSLLIIAIFIVCFLYIHPFQDGNGRLSRLLTTLLLLKAGYAYVPFSSLESIIEENKEGYYRALRKTQMTLKKEAPEWSPWIIFFLRSLVKQKERLEKKIEHERIFAFSIPELGAKILELARNHGRIKIADIEKLTGESRSTIKLRLNILTRDGLLLRHGKGRSTWYTLS